MSIPIILSAISILFSLITILKINKKYKLKEGTKMKKLLKALITLTAIGVAVKVVKDKSENDKYSSWVIRSRDREDGFGQMIEFLKNMNRTYIAHEWLDDRIHIYSKPHLISKNI